jgi:DNA-binding IclR family transcriptional regulator
LSGEAGVTHLGKTNDIFYDERVARWPDGQAPLARVEPAAPEKTLRLSPFACVRPPGRVYNMAKSAVRALEIVEFIARSAEPIRGVDISRALSISPSSTHQILKSLMDWGYLLFDVESKCYHLSPRVTGLGACFSANYFGPGVLNELLNALQEASGRTISLVASQGSFMQVIECVGPKLHLPPTASSPPVESDPVGWQLPYFGSSAGAAWLSAQTDAVVLKVFQRSRRELGKLARNEAQVLETLRRVRRQGYAYSGALLEGGSWSVAAPLPPAANGVVLVLGVSIGSEENEQEAAHLGAVINRCIDLHLGPGRRPG